MPKPVLHTHANYLELLDRVLAPLRGDGCGGAPARRPTPNLVPVSLALNAGIYNVLFGLRAGAEIVVMDGFDPRVFAELVGRFAIRSTVLPPAAMAMLNDEPEVVDLAPLRYVRSITAPLSPLQARRFADKFGIVVLNGYGQAEIGEVIGWTAADAREHPDKLGAVGRPHPGVSIRIAPAEPGTEAVGENIGRLLVRPPSTAVGIAAARVDADGYVDTGDLARIDDDGFVWIEGRASDVINRGGNKVFPEHVEEVLRLVPGVSEAAVVGVPDDRLGEIPVAFIVATVAGRRRRSDRRVPRASRAVQGSGRVPPRRRVAAQRSRQGVAPRTRADVRERAELANRRSRQADGRSRDGCAGRVAQLRVGVRDAIADPRDAVVARSHGRVPTAHDRGDLRRDRRRPRAPRPSGPRRSPGSPGCRRSRRRRACPTDLASRRARPVASTHDTCVRAPLSRQSFPNSSSSECRRRGSAS